MKTWRVSGWRRWTVLALVLVGVTIAGYLAYVSLVGIDPACGGLQSDCHTVHTSRYVRIGGVLPIALLGLIFYLALLGLWWWGGWTQGPFAGWTPLAFFELALAGVLFSAYLTYLETFVLRAMCPWCVGSAVTATVMCGLAAPAALDMLE